MTFHSIFHNTAFDFPFNSLCISYAGDPFREPVLIPQSTEVVTVSTYSCDGQKAERMVCYSLISSFQLFILYFTGKHWVKDGLIIS